MHANHASYGEVCLVCLIVLFKKVRIWSNSFKECLWMKRCCLYVVSILILQYQLNVNYWQHYIIVRPRVFGLYHAIILKSVSLERWYLFIIVQALNFINVSNVHTEVLWPILHSICYSFVYLLQIKYNQILGGNVLHQDTFTLLYVEYTFACVLMIFTVLHYISTYSAVHISF